MVGSGIGIEQDNDYYIAAIAFNSQQWFTSTIPNLRSTDFVHIRNSVTGLTEPTKKPDFSLNGAPIQFGYERGSTLFGFQDIRTGIDNWTVKINVPEAGLHTVTLATDQQVGGIDFGNHKLPAPNQAPLITSTPPAAVSLGSTLRYDVKASDANGDSLSYALLKNPPGMVIDPKLGVLIWTPKSSQIGRTEVTLEVADGNGGTTRQSFELVVKGANLRPQIVSSPPTGAALNQPYRYAVLATDPDGDPLTYSLVRSPAGMTIDPASGVISHTPTSSASSVVEILVSDGFGGSSRQSYELTVNSVATSRLPRIDSIPQVITGAGGLYEYQVTATDPANSVLTFALVKPPAGMVVDPQSGRISWEPAASVQGPFVITISATNAAGLQALQSFGLTVTPNQAPILGSTPPPKAQAGALFKYDVLGGDADGNLLSYRLVQSPAGMSIDAFGRLRWQPTEADRGTSPVVIEVSDGRGGLTRQEFLLEVSSADITAPVLELGYSSTLVNKGGSVELQVRARDNFSVVALTLTANDQPLTLTPGEPNRVLNTARLENLAAGRYRVVATATDAAGNRSSETVEIRVVDPADTVAPVITIDRSNLLPSEGVLRTPTDVVVSVNDVNLDGYRVELAPLDAVNLDQLGADDPAFVLLAEGNSTVVNQVVASLDPRLYANGSYLLRVVGYDLSGNGTAEGVILTLESGGLGDFGYGWQLTMQDARITEASPDGRDLQASGGDLFGSSTAFSVGTRVSLTTPEGRRVSFTFDAVPTSANLFGTVYSPRFKADAGVFDRLEVDDAPLSLRGDGTVGSFLFSFIGYNPSLYRLISKDGTTYHYDQFFGLQKVVDRNGNTLTYSDSGITSSTGTSVSFQRDGQGRITSITDPAGQAIRYSYDSNGNLATVTDREDASTSMRYDDAGRPHYLTEVKDPLGRKTSRTEFDSKGQISKLIDADGHVVEVNLDSAASRQTVKDPLGNSTTRLFDDRGRVVQEFDSLGGKTLYSYDTNDNLLSRTDPEGQSTLYTYDGRGNRLSETNGKGDTTTYTYNDRNDLLTQKDPLGNITTYDYDAKGNRTRRTDAAGFVSSYTYDANGLPTKITDPTSEMVTFSYDGRGQVIGIIDPSGAAFSLSYDANGRVTSSTDGVGAITRYTYDVQGRLLDTIDALGGIKRSEYDAAGQLIAEVDALGRRTAFRYDGRGNRIETILPDATPGADADNPRQRQSFDALDRLIASTDELGRSTHYVYDALGRQVEQILPDATSADLGDNPRRRQDFDKAGRLIATIDERGNRSTSSYDAADGMTRWTNALDQVTSYGYDAAGRQTSITDALGRTTTFGYDPLGQLISSTYANGTAMSQRRDGMGRVIEQTDLSGLKTGYTYDGLGRLTAVIDALNQRTEYRYDAAGNLIEQQDANGHITTFGYDLLRRQVSATLPGGQVSQMAYDAFGNLIEATDANGISTHQSFDARNWLVEKRFSDSTPTEQFRYTATGQLVSVIDNRGTTTYQYDERDRLLGRSEPDGRAITYTYDAAGNILSLNVPSGRTHYGYDALNRLKTVTDADGGVAVYGYDSVGNLVSTLFANDVKETRRYDDLNRLTFLENRSSSDVVLSSYAYSLDAMGNRTRVVEADGRTVNYSYDDLYRLVQESITDPVNGNRTIAYLMDAVGNRLKRTDSVEGITTYSYDVNDRLLEEVLGGNTISYQYDANGSLTAKVSGGSTLATYTWNAKGELSQAEVTNNGVTTNLGFDYDASGMRVFKTEGGIETRYLLDNTFSKYAQVVEGYQADGTLLSRYTLGNRLLSRQDDLYTSYYLVDGHGSIRKTTDLQSSVQSSYPYYAFGIAYGASISSSNNNLYAGEQLDKDLDLYYLRARYYDPENGTFLSLDPIPGRALLPLTLNDYVYVIGNPVSFTDPSGTTFLETLETYKGVIDLVYKVLDIGIKIIALVASLTLAAIAVSNWLSHGNQGQEGQEGQGQGQPQGQSQQPQDHSQGTGEPYFWWEHLPTSVSGDSESFGSTVGSRRPL
ncbi:MAG: putative Ig domain-containing protein [Cyanobacteria bacterium]|nr:putative Ig domain-containing protein [Cyanobacteriota bacterium]